MAGEISEEMQQKIGELQLLQQQLSIFSSQKQQLQVQQSEIDNALAEMGDAKPPVYKLIGEVLVAREKPALEKELKEKLEDISVRLKSIDKQEEQIRTRAKNLQKEITTALK